MFVSVCWTLSCALGVVGGEKEASARSCTRPADGAATTLDRLKVVSYNVHHCRGGIEPIVDFLRGQNADVVFLQEVSRRRAGAEDQAGQIAKALGDWHGVSASTLRLPASQACDEAILSRFELCDPRAHAVGQGEWVYAVAARVKRPGRNLHLLSVHTRSTSRLKPGHVIASSQARLAQVSHLLEEIRKLEGDVIVAGDFNAAPWMPEYYGITRLLTDFGAACGATQHTFPSGRPMVRIDYVFGRGEFVARAYRVVNCLASDHRPVVVEMERARPGERRRPAQRRSTAPDRPPGEEPRQRGRSHPNK